MLEEVERQFGTQEFVGVHARVEGDWGQQCQGAQNRTDPDTMLFGNKHQCWVCDPHQLCQLQHEASRICRIMSLCKFMMLWQSQRVLQPLSQRGTTVQDTSAGTESSKALVPGILLWLSSSQSSPDPFT